MDPVTALMIAKGGAEALGGFFNARATNSAARQNFRNAQIDAAFQYTQNQRQRIETNRALNERGLDAAMQARAATASARNSAAAGGVQGSTMDALVAEELRLGAQNQRRLEVQRENNDAAARANALGIKSQTQSRINQTPTSSFGLLDIAAIVAPAALAIKKHNDSLDQIGS